MTTTLAAGATETHADRLKDELYKIGIRTDADLREAIRKLPALQIGIMTDPIKSRLRKGGEVENVMLGALFLRQVNTTSRLQK